MISCNNFFIILNSTFYLLQKVKKRVKKLNIKMLQRIKNALAIKTRSKLVNWSVIKQGKN